jgi:hypothetical protein
MQLLNPHSEGRSNVRVLGVSTHCVEVLSPIPVLPGTLMQLHLHSKGIFLLGEARCCKTHDGTFEVDVDIEDTYTPGPGGGFTQLRHFTQG